MSQLINTDNLNNSVSDDTNLYKSYTHKLNDYNELYNANKQLNEINKHSYQDITQFNDNIDTKLHILKQNYLLKESGIHQYEMRCNIILFTIIISSLLLYIIACYVDGRLNNKKLYYIMGSIILVYLFIVWIIVKFISWRKNKAWNQYYF